MAGTAGLKAADHAVNKKVMLTELDSMPDFWNFSADDFMELGELQP